MTSEEWIAAFAAALDVAPPDGPTTEVLLALAGTAAHQSQRTAAPIACYLVGRAGVDPRRAAQVAEAIEAPGH
jgi:Domain of unknown function (DUF6457)